MPIYTYQIIEDDGTEGETFTTMHGMDEPALECHPETGQKVVRVFTAPHLANWNNERLQKQRLDNKNVEKMGFTKYVRNGKGHYERQAGGFGPKELHPGDAK